MKIFNEVTRWIKILKKQIKLQFKVNFDAAKINIEEVIYFLNSNHIIELNLSGLSEH